MKPLLGADFISMYMDLLEKCPREYEEDNLYGRNAGDFAGICFP